MILIGTSGWQYDDWRGVLYPADLPKKQWLGYFARAFPTVEVNNTFYRLPERSTFAGWRESTPGDFVWTVKASRFITHIKRLRDCEEPVHRLWERISALGGRLGPVLFQLPPTLQADAALLKDFLDLLPASIRPAVEFRHRSWHDDEVFDVLDRAGAAHVLADGPGARVKAVVTGGWSYIRFHKGRHHASGYRREKLRRWADRIGALEVRDVYVYFNNDPGGAAVRDARTLSVLLSDRTDRAVRGPSEAEES